MTKRRSKKETREFEVLLGLVELYLETGKPIGSSTLQEHGFKNLSTATIRNYFGELENQGYLRQPHFSGGRIPTNEAFRYYAKENFTKGKLPFDAEEKIKELSSIESRNLFRYLQNAAEKLSSVTGYASFLSSVRFDHDFILEVKLVDIDQMRILCVLITDFGQILTEILSTDEKIRTFSLKRIESNLQWRVKGGAKPSNLTPLEEELSQKFYNEILLRYLVRYSNFSSEDLYRTGFSQLLAYQEFNDPIALTTGLALFENVSSMRLLLNDCVRRNSLQYWIGSDLAPYVPSAQGCSIIAVPYYIGQTAVGAAGILGPCRMPYSTLFGTLTYFSECISKSLTKSLLKNKISFRQPHTPSSRGHEERIIVDKTSKKLLEIKEQI